MKRGKILFSILFAMLVLIPIKVSATSNVALSGQSSIGPGDTVVYDIQVATTDSATNIKTELTYDTTVLELVSIVNKQWQGNNKIGSSPTSLEFTTNGATGNSTVASLTFKVKSGTTKNTTSLKLTGTTVSVVANGSDSIVSVPEYEKSVNINSTDATLSSLKINDKSVNGFRSKTYNYNIIVDSTVATADIKATTTNSNATFVSNFEPREVNLQYGENKVQIKVQAESGDIKIYTLNITREDTTATNNYLKDIIINGGEVPIDFDKLVLDYTIKTYKLEKLEIEATAEDSTSTVNINKPNQIIIGENKVQITVKSQSGKEQIYTITIVNSDTEIDTKLKNLSVKGLSIDFDPNKLDYEIVYTKDMKEGLKIYATTISKDAEIEIIGNEDLKVGSKVQVKVFAEDGSETIYTITLVKDTRINFFMLLEILIIIILIILIVIQIIKRKKKNNKQKPKKEEPTKKEEQNLNDSPTMEMNTAEFKLK